MQRVIGLVPVRGGSKGLVDKNLRKVGGVALYARAVAQAAAAGLDHTFVSTDIDQLVSGGLGDGVTVVRRDDSLATDATPMSAVVADFLDSEGADGVVVLLQPTSPLRQSWQIAEAVELFRTRDCDLVMSVTVADSGVLKWGMSDGDRFVPLADIDYTFMNRQRLPEVVRPNGAIYVFEAEWFRQNRGFGTDRVLGYRMDSDTSVDVDSATDLIKAEKILGEMELK